MFVVPTEQPATDRKAENVTKTLSSSSPTRLQNRAMFLHTEQLRQEIAELKRENNRLRFMQEYRRVVPCDGNGMEAAAHVVDDMLRRRTGRHNVYCEEPPSPIPWYAHLPGVTTTSDDDDDDEDIGADDDVLANLL